MLLLMDGSIFSSRPIREKDGEFYVYMFELCDQGKLPMIANSSGRLNSISPRLEEVRKK